MFQATFKYVAGLILGTLLLTSASGCGDRPSNSNNPTKPELGTEGDPSTIPQPPGD